MLRTMPLRVAAFMLYESRGAPPWRYCETGAEREWREQCGERWSVRWLVLFLRPKEHKRDITGCCNLLLAGQM